jgi:hypothetical protein
MVRDLEKSMSNPKFAEAVMPRIPARRWGSIEDFDGPRCIWRVMRLVCDGEQSGVYEPLDLNITQDALKPEPSNRNPQTSPNALALRMRGDLLRQAGAGSRHPSQAALLGELAAWQGLRSHSSWGRERSH